jgi:hypothetical protein
VLTGSLDFLETQPQPYFRLLFNAGCPDSLTSFCTFLTKFLRQWDQQIVPNVNGRLPHLTRACMDAAMMMALPSIKRAKESRS